MNSVPLSCPSCSAPLRATDEICPFCGHVTGMEARPETPPAPPPQPPPPPLQEARPLSREAVDGAATEPIPWENWREFGFFNALWLTWRDSVFRPVPFFRRMPPRSGFGSAVAYAVLVTIVGFFFSFYWSAIRNALGGTAEEGVAFSLAGSLVALLFGLALLVPFYVGFLFVGVGVVHLGFMAVGAGRRGYEATFRATAYASGPAAFAVFPFFGPVLSVVWGMTLLFIAVREAQRTTNGRAALGFLIPLLAFILIVLILGALFELLISSMDLSGSV